MQHKAADLLEQKWTKKNDRFLTYTLRPEWANNIIPWPQNNKLHMKNVAEVIFSKPEFPVFFRLLFVDD